MLIIAGVLAIAGTAMAIKFVAPVLIGIASLGSALVPLLFNPWTWVILAIIALGILLYTHWDTVSKFLKTIWDGIKNVWNITVDYLSNKMLVFYNTLVAIWTGFKNFWIALWQGLKDTIQNAWSYIEGVINKVISAVNRALSAIASLASKAGSGISGAVSSAVSAITGKKAGGGVVESGRSYIVGEQGPEVFVPSMGGSIIPNGAGVGGGSIMVDMRGSTFLDRTAAVQIGDMIIRRLREIHRISN
jgi:phage-related protein